MNGESDPHRFKKLSLKQLPKRKRYDRDDEKFWRKFQFPAVVREYGAVTSVHFSSAAPHDFAVTSGSRIQVYSGVSNQVKKTIARFQEVAYSGRFRGDGKLLAAGTEEGVVKVFDVTSRAVLRQCKGHKKPTKAVSFSSDGLRLLSGSDDTTVRHWDIATETCLTSLTGHEDYVRGVVPSPASSDLFLSSSYDHRLRLWDVRCEATVLQVDHGAPVEATLVFPSGGTCVSAGGSYVKVWDLLSGGKLLAAFSSHSKTVTALAFDGASQRLLSAGLDKMVKVHSVEDYRVIYSLTYPAPILSVAVSPSDSHVVVGMTNRLLSIRHCPHRHSEGEEGEEGFPALTFEKPKGGTYRYFVRGKKYKPLEDEYIVAVTRKTHLLDYEKELKRFQYKAALDAALKKKFSKSQDQDRARMLYSLLQELARRDGLAAALAGRTEQELRPLLSFLEDHMLNPKLSPFLLDVCEMVVDIYGSVVSVSTLTRKSFSRLSVRVGREISLHSESSQLLGMLDSILTAASSSERLIHRTPPEIQPPGGQSMQPV